MPGVSHAGHGGSRLLLPRLPTFEQRLNPAQGFQVAIRESSGFALLKTFRQNIGEGIDRDSHGHRLIMGQLDSADRNYCFVLHASSATPLEPRARLPERAPSER